MTRRGFTLVELLLVISLIAVVLGIGLGVFARLDFSDRSAVAQVEDAIRSAHNWAIARQAPARVTIDAKRNSIRATGMQVVGTWHFERLPLDGAFGLEGSCFGGDLVDDGFQGKALSFARAPSRSRAEFAIQKSPAWSLRDGFSVRLAMRMDAARGASALQIGESVGIDTGELGSIRGWISPEVLDDQGNLQKGGRIPLEAPPGTLRPGRWSQVELQYDRKRLRILVDEVVAAEVLEVTPVWRLEGPLVLSPGSAAWPGALDNLVVSAVGGDDETLLPRTVAFAAGAPAEIRFQAGGGLDRSVHREPVRLAIELEDGRKIPILVNLYGTIE